MIEEDTNTNPIHTPMNLHMHAYKQTCKHIYSHSIYMTHLLPCAKEKKGGEEKEMTRAELGAGGQALS